MSISKATTDLSTLKINKLTQDMYDDALENSQINGNELYMTPFDCGYTVEESKATLHNLVLQVERGTDYNVPYDLIWYGGDSNYINSDCLEITIAGVTYKCLRQPGDNYCYAYFGENVLTWNKVNWTDYPFILALFDVTVDPTVTPWAFYLKPNYFNSPLYMTVKTVSQTVATTSEFEAAITHVLTTNLDSAEGGSY